MKWRYEDGVEFRALASAGYSVEVIAERLSKPPSSIKRYATMHGIIIKGYIGKGDLRKRWAMLIGPMKEQLRASIGRILT